MENSLVDIGIKLAHLVATNNPRYPIHIPFNLFNTSKRTTEEWVLSFTTEWEYHNGFYIFQEDTKEMKLFNDLIELILFFKESLVDNYQLESRIDIAAQSSASVLLRSIDKLKETFGEELIDKALEIDPTYAPGWVLKALILSQQADVGARLPNDILEPARDAVDRALELDPNNAAAYAISGDVMLSFERDFAGGGRALEKALE